MTTYAKPIRLTQYSHGAGCGCKIAPSVLERMLANNVASPDHERLLVGNDVRDDAAVYDLGDGTALISTTDFFMPIVDDARTFGRIAAANAISDVYAMGGRPVLAIAIFGWPIDQLPESVAAEVLTGGREACAEAGIPLAGGHSIDSPEPIFGLAVNGIVAIDRLKRNSTARPGDLLYLTKALGIGILTTAEKRAILRAEDEGIAAHQMMQLNAIGERLASMQAVHAMTDITGFGLLGHLREMCAGSGVAAEIYYDDLPLITDLTPYLDEKCVPGGTGRNWESYGDVVAPLDERRRQVLCDPQTSGGILIAVDPQARKDVEDVFRGNGLSRFTRPIGKLHEKTGDVLIEVI